MATLHPSLENVVFAQFCKPPRCTPISLCARGFIPFLHTYAVHTPSHSADLFGVLASIMNLVSTRHVVTALSLAHTVLITAASASRDLPTAALDSLSFYDDGSSGLTPIHPAPYGGRLLDLTSLNSGLWAAANATVPEQPFNQVYVRNDERPTAFAYCMHPPRDVH